MKDKKMGLLMFKVALKMFWYELFYFWNENIKKGRKLAYLNSLGASEIAVTAPMIIADMKLNSFESKKLRIKYAKLSSYLR